MRKKRENYFIETAIYDHNFYGTAFKDVKTKTVVIVEPNGANNIIKAGLKDTVIIFFDASEDIRVSRMQARGDDEKSIVERIKGDRDIFITDNLNHIDFIVETNVKTQYEIAEDINSLYLKEVAHD